jgi:hypothetical protein
MKASVLALFLLLTAAAAMAQTPTATPPANQPPGSEPQTPPTAPPSGQQPAPQAPPGTVVAPATQPTTPPTTTDPLQQEPREPNFPNSQAQPLPPMPDLTRVGIINSNILTLSMNDAIRTALKNNNDIEMARDDVRFAETQLRSLRGVYDPVFSVTPTYDKRVNPVTSIFAGGSSTGTVSTTTYTLSPTLSRNFETGGGPAGHHERHEQHVESFLFVKPVAVLPAAALAQSLDRCQPSFNSDSEQIHRAIGFRFSPTDDSNYFAGAGRLLEPGVRVAKPAKPVGQPESGAREHEKYRSAD